MPLRVHKQHLVVHAFKVKYLSVLSLQDRAGILCFIFKSLTRPAGHTARNTGMMGVHVFFVVLLAVIGQSHSLKIQNSANGLGR